MIKAEYTMKLGSEEVKITIDAESHVDFVDKLSFFTTIPKKGPNGEEDLRLVHRVAQNKFHYYSLISDSAKMEYKFGQSLENKGALFCKGQWEPLFTGDGTDQQETQSQSQTQTTQQTVTQPAKAVTAAVKTVTPTTTKTMPTTPTTTTPVTTAKPLASVNLAKPAVTTAVKTQPATTQVQAQTTTPAQPASTPAPPKSNAAAAILAKMNINKTT